MTRWAKSRDLDFAAVGLAGQQFQAQGKLVSGNGIHFLDVEGNLLGQNGGGQIEGDGGRQMAVQFVERRPGHGQVGAGDEFAELGVDGVVDFAHLRLDDELGRAVSRVASGRGGWHGARSVR